MRALLELPAQPLGVLGGLGRLGLGAVLPLLQRLHLRLQVLQVLLRRV